MKSVYPNHTETPALPEGPVSRRKSEVVLSSGAALETLGEGVRKALQSELIPGGGEVLTRTRSFVCWTNIAK